MDRLLYALSLLGVMVGACSGAQVTEALHTPALVIDLMGTIPSVAGGVLRDVLSGETPLLFREGEIYGTAAIAGAGIYLLAEPLGRPAAPRCRAWPQSP